MRNQLCLDVPQQRLKHLWEGLEEDRFERERAPFLLEDSVLNLLVLVFDQVEDAFDSEMVEHGLVGTFEPSHCLLEISHHLPAELVEGKLVELAIEILQEDGQLVLEEIVFDQNQGFCVRIFNEVEHVRVVEGSSASK